jgi:thioester reductase-like protein
MLIARNAKFGKNVFKQKLEQVKLAYRNKKDKKPVADQRMANKITNYLISIRNLQIDYTKRKRIKNILLTGATGYLGCNILNQLLINTNYNIHLLIRAKNYNEAFGRINKKYKFYFDKLLEGAYKKRIFIYVGDIESGDLSLSVKDYEVLKTKIDSCIHAAAITKHYGEYDKFYSVNVNGTRNLLELCKLTKLKDFHYISTYSVLNFGDATDYGEHIYTEEDSPDNLKQGDNVYIQTKLQGEQLVVDYRKYGLSTNIYRAGNLAFMSQDGRVQENKTDNAFFNWLKCLLKIKYITRELNMVEISPADFTALVIVKLFDKKELENGIYHVFNPHLFNIAKALKNDINLSVKTISIDKFVNYFLENLDDNIDNDIIVRFLLRQGWLDGWDTTSTTSIQVLQNKTEVILNQLGFKWPKIKQEVFKNFIKKAYQ